jgi:lysophospholipase L1-like esterase
MSVARKGLAALFTALVLATAPMALASDSRASDPRGSDPCEAPADLAGPIEPLRHAARAVATRKALRVLVVGSASSTLGGTSAPQAAYPQRLEADLRARLPQVDVTVQTRGGRGLAASDLAALMEAALPEFHPDLVVWQTGTVDAVNGVDPDEFAAVLRAGADKVAAAAIDLILMDQQFSRLARATLNYTPYRQAIEAVANAGDAMLLRRYDLMKYWAESGQIDLERAPRRDWQRTADTLHACIAKVLAGTIVKGMRDAGR